MNVTKSLVRVFAGKAFIYSYRGIAVNPDFNSKSETTNNLPSHFLNIIKINVDQSESAALIFFVRRTFNAAEKHAAYRRSFYCPSASGRIF